MKKIATFVIVLIMIISIALPTKAALAAGNSPSQLDNANILYGLGLFRGTDKGYELERTLTRGEAAALLTRFLGGEEEALKKNYSSPFTDLPAWLKPYVGWLYVNGLTKGTSANSYSPHLETKFGHFALFMGRAVGVEDESIEYGFEAVSAQEYAEHKDRYLSRGEAVEIAVKTLYAWHYLESKSLAAVLTDKGVLTREKLDKVVTPVLGCTYEMLASGNLDHVVTRKVFSVTVAQATVGVLSLFGPPSFYEMVKPDSMAAIFCHDASTIYALDPLTLEHTAIAELDSGRHYWSLLGVLPTAACLLITDAQGNGTLYMYQDGAVAPVLENCCKAVSTPKDSPTTEWYTYMQQDSILVCGVYGIVRFDNEGGFKHITKTLAHSVYEQDSELYYIPKLDDAIAAKITDIIASEREGFHRGGLEVRRIVPEEGETELIATLDGQKYGMMMNEILSVSEGVVQFRANYFYSIGMTSGGGEGSFIYELRDGVPTVLAYEGGVPQGGSNEEVTQE